MIIAKILIMGKKKSKKEKEKKEAKKAGKLAKQLVVAKEKKKADKKKKKLKKKSEKKINKAKSEENTNQIVKEAIIEKPILVVVQDEPKETVSKSVVQSETTKTLTGSRRLTAQAAIAKIKTYKTKSGIDNFTQFENRLTVLKAAKVKKRQLK
jgi:hypothetical protein|tara:strand:+ start:59 stop:517 length:459 start_codon:yes stop_codon:yes gene_type:complete